MYKRAAYGEFGHALLRAMKKERAAAAYRRGAIAGGNKVVDLLVQDIPKPIGPALDKVFYAKIPGLDRFSLPTPREYVGAFVHDPGPIIAHVASPPGLGTVSDVAFRASQRRLIDALNRRADNTPREQFRRRVARTLAWYAGK